MAEAAIEFRGNVAVGLKSVYSVELAIVEVLIQAAVDLIGSGDNEFVELASGGMSVLGREHVLKHGELADSVVGNVE